MVLLNLNLKLACGKLTCIFHSSSSVFCKLVNDPAHAQKFVVSISCAFRGIAQISETRLVKVLEAWKACMRYLPKAKEPKNQTEYYH